MSNFITSSVSWSGKETTDIFLRPLAIGPDPIASDYFRIILNIKSGQKLNYIGTASKRLKAYAAGFTGAAGPAYTQRDLNTYKLKAEAETDANVFFNTVLEQLQGKDWNDLSDSELKNVIMQIFVNGVKDDIFRIAWLADPYKEGLASTTYGSYNGVADTDYNALTDGGVWYKLFANSATSPSSSQIQRVDVNATITGGYVAQIQTVTLTGSSGTCNVAVGGVNYLATYTGGSITNTDAAFISSHAAALLLRGIVVSGTTTLIFTSNVPGQPFETITVSAAVTGDLTGSVAATLANTAPSALASGKSVDIMDKMYTDQPYALKGVDDMNKVYLVSYTIYDNYRKYLQGVSGVEGAWVMTQSGKKVLSYNGIPVIPMKWDQHLQDFPHANGYLPARIHRAILTEKGNLVIGIDNTDQYQQVDFWFNKDLEMNRFRAKLNLGVNYVHNEMLVSAY